MGSKKKKTVVLDFSTAQTGPKPSEFEVEDYDYEQRQRQKKTGFDEDLEFLLSQEQSSDGKIGNSGKILGGSARDNAHGMPSSTSESSEANRDAALEIEQISSKVGEIVSKKTKTKKRASHKEVQRTTRKEITGDLGDIEFSSDEEVSEAQRVKKEKKEKRKKEKKEQKEKEEQEKKSSEPEPNFVPFEELDVPQPAAKKDRKKKKKQQKQKSPDHVTSSTGTESDAPAVSRPSSEPPAAPKSEQTEAENAKPKSKKKKASKKKAAEAAADAAAAGTDTEASHADVNADVAVADTPSNSHPVLHGSRQIRETTPVKDVQPPKRSPSPSPSPRPDSAASKSSPSKATLVKQLPAVQPVSTIFGLSHDQICKTKLSDVKIKTIVNVPMSKMCKNALQFVLAETDGLFVDPAKTSQFVDLCVNVALHEAPGFNEVTKRIPQLLDWIPHCEPLLLSHTKTNVTLSTKQMHQNSLDYTVFSFFGHILIWACELQYAEKQETIFEKYELGISRPQILKSLGGYHLWDRLRRDKTINTKRWKHIQKFRSIFAFEEHQFVLILRCLNLGMTIC